ncbi:hypothetical protein ACFX4S_14870 [Kosakonia sp. YIM B13605]|uniref:hypothetical protein n=1 Tax=unclassified Kosakonia TaxID=2632876 RepID=UPI0036A0ED4F
MMKDLLLITFCVAVGFQAFVAAMSFVLWQNAYRVMGHGYIIRLTIFMVALSWIIYFIPRGA